MSTLTHSPEWQALLQHRDGFHKTISQLFAEDEARFEKFSIGLGALLVDFSKHRMTDETRQLLLDLAQALKLETHIDALFHGEKMNASERRAAMHIALRDRSGEWASAEIKQQVDACLSAMTDMVTAIHNGEWRGATGERITDVVNIGIGGSDLGARTVVAALPHLHKKTIRVHFVANIDAADLTSTLTHLKPETTLFIVATKSFATRETLQNARTALAWYPSEMDRQAVMRQHFIAVTANAKAACAFGMPECNILPVWEWVGGRYSLWSAMGLPIALAVGMTQFEALLAGANEMDRHFKTAPLAENIPVMMGLLGVWYINFWKAYCHGVVPYSHGLRYFPDYIKQLDMESNGKRLRTDGEPVDYQTGPVIWGGVGSNSQHAFHQLLFQGTHLIPVDFIAVAQSAHAAPAHHTLQLANCISQSAALMQGIDYETVLDDLLAAGVREAEAKTLAHHKMIPGNTPSTTFLLPELSPHHLGALLAAYEHKVFVQSKLWGINCFDQWGVELGKRLGETVHQQLTGDAEIDGAEHDASTRGLLGSCGLI